MSRSDIFKELDKIEDPETDIQKILSNLHYTHHFLMDKYKKLLSGYDLTSPQVNVLGIVYHYNPEPMTLESIKEVVLEQNADVSRLVSRLVEKGLLVKETDKVNRRKVSIKITPKGLNVIAEITTDKLFRKFTSNISVEEARIFSSILNKIRSAEV